MAIYLCSDFIIMEKNLDVNKGERNELNKQQLAISFHPELDGDNRLHQYFVQMVSSSLNKEK